jgi:hypothetical protein
MIHIDNPYHTVQEVLLRILFSAPFEEFVKDLQDWLRSTKDRLS